MVRYLGAKILIVYGIFLGVNSLLTIADANTLELIQSEKVIFCGNNTKETKNGFIISTKIKESFFINDNIITTADNAFSARLAYCIEYKK